MTRDWRTAARFGRVTKDTSVPELLDGVRAGSPAHFGELYRRFHPVILQSLRSVAGDEAEDLTQETFLKLVDKLEDYQDRGSFEPWLKGVAHNLARTRRRSLERRREELLDTGHGLPTGPGATGAVTREDFWGHALRAMPGPLREVWALHVQGFEAKDIAAQMGMSPNAAATKLSRARRYLEEELRRMEGR